MRRRDLVLRKKKDGDGKRLSPKTFALPNSVSQLQCSKDLLFADKKGGLGGIHTIHHICRKNNLMIRLKRKLNASTKADAKAQKTENIISRISPHYNLRKIYSVNDDILLSYFAKGFMNFHSAQPHKYSLLFASVHKASIL